ncbi:hypothetical protein Baya_4752 [Bagarius yarrelli]|uniref:Uncharacterized protein n=1 Tax=Bagarius yarrelli TaxID=175774 RepID=A0A556TTF9_BAGYA|nr:hypothetical protein Baya_4752 [Bagarius yarrelli]
MMADKPDTQPEMAISPAAPPRRPALLALPWLITSTSSQSVSVSSVRPFTITRPNTGLLRGQEPDLIPAL